jgi:hypothetical protein
MNLLSPSSFSLRLFVDETGFGIVLEGMGGCEHIEMISITLICLG